MIVLARISSGDSYVGYLDPGCPAGAAAGLGLPHSREGRSRGATSREEQGATAVRIGLLGGFEVSEGDRRVADSAWRLRKAKTLIKLLALEPGHRIHRDQLADQLWPELDADAARNNLHQALHAARRALSTIGVDGTAALALRDDLVVLGRNGHVVTDLEEFQDAVEQASATENWTELAAVLSRWPGELLPEDAYEPWVQHHANRIREWRTGLVMKLVDDDLAERDPQTAVGVLAPIVAANRLHEPVHRAMMRALRSRRSPCRGIGDVRTAPRGAAAGARRGPGAANPSALPGSVGKQ